MRMMNNEIIESLKQIAAEKNLKMDVVMETLKTGLLTAAMKSYGTSENINVRVDHNTAEIAISATKKVVETVNDDRFEISLSDAKQYDEQAGIDQEVNVPLSLADFGRNAIQTIKQILIQRTREAERENIFDNYKGRIGEVVSCVVQSMMRGDVIAMIGKVEALLPRREQVRSERYFRGDTMRAMVLDVQKSAKGPQIILTRNNPDFVKKLFEIEVPEIFEGIVQIRGVAREAGERTKISVYSQDEKIDALGACVGMKGIRIQSVVRELNNEKIDIIPWSEEPIEMTGRAMSPATVKDIIRNPRSDNALYVIVEDDQLSIAIGKNGQNVKLASKLVGMDIDLMTEADYAKELERAGRADEAIADTAVLEKDVRDKLAAAGITRLGEVEDRTIKDLMAALEADEEEVQRIYRIIDEYINPPEESEEEDAGDGTADGAADETDTAETTEAAAEQGEEKQV